MPIGGADRVAGSHPFREALNAWLSDVLLVRDQRTIRTGGGQEASQEQKRRLKTAMRHEVTYEWTPEFARLCVRRFLVRHAGPSIVGCLVLLGVGLSGLITGTDSGFWEVVTILAGGYLLLWVRHYFSATRTLAEAPGRRIVLRVGPETVTFETSEHTSTMKWSLVKKLWSFPDVLLLFTYGRWNYLAVPVAPLGEELRRFILDKVKESGGKVA